VQEYQQAVNNAQSQLAGGNARRRLIHHLDDFSNGKPSWESETTLSLYRPLNGLFKGK
jgi:hypothetical protein